MEDTIARPRSLPPQLETLAGFWLSMGQGALLPWREDFTPRALKPWLGNLALLEPLPAAGFRFRLCGTRLLPRFGFDTTGQLVADLPAAVGLDLGDRLDRAAALQAPVIGRLQVRSNLETVDFFELVLPLWCRETAARLFLLGAYPAPRYAANAAPIASAVSPAFHVTGVEP